MVDFEKYARERNDWVKSTGGAAQGGLTVLDAFAIEAMGAMLSNLDPGKEHQVALIPETAYTIAKLMLKAKDACESPQDVVQGVTGRTYG